jgi:thioredoxin 1
MKSRLTKNLTGFAIALLAGVVGLAAYCHFTSDCLFASTRRSSTSEETNGEKPMSTATENAVVHVDEKSFRAEVLQSKVPVLVDFYADWCGPCRILGPVLEELAQETPNAKIVKVDVDDNPKLAGRYGVSSIPNLLVFDDGRIVHQQAGLASKEQLKSLLTDERPATQE